MTPLRKLMIGGFLLIGSVYALGAWNGSSNAEWIDTSKVPADNIGNYPRGTTIRSAYDQCLFNSVQSGDHWQVTQKKCDSSLGQDLCIQQGLPAGRAYALHMTQVGSENEKLDARCFDVLGQKYAEKIEKYGTKAQKESLRIASQKPEAVDTVKKNEAADITEAARKAFKTAEASNSPTPNCQQAQMNGQTVQACRDSNGRYKISPLDGHDAVNVTIAPEDKLAIASQCYKRSLPGDILSSALGSPSCYIADDSNTSCFHSQEACDSDQRLKVINARNAKARAEQKPPSVEHKRLLGDYYRCLYRSFGRGEFDHTPFQSCLDSAITLCNGDGMPTSRNYRISSVTGRVALDNNQCSMMLEGYYSTAQRNFAEEYELYSRSEDMGVPYTPQWLDIRQYIGRGY